MHVILARPVALLRSSRDIFLGVPPFLGKFTLGKKILTRGWARRLYISAEKVAALNVEIKEWRKSKRKREEDSNQKHYVYILTDIGDVTMIDARMNNKRSRQNPGAFNPYDKVCDDEMMVCCKGKCREEAGRAVKKSAGGSTSAVGTKKDAFCPGDFTGYKRIPSVHSSTSSILSLLSIKNTPET